MGQNLLLCAELWWFRRGPADFPYSKVLLGIFVIANLLVTYAIDQMVTTEGAVHLMPLELLSYVLLAIFVWIVLWFTDHMPRYLQTLTAFYGAELIANSASLVVILVTVPYQLTTMMSLFALILYFWTLAVYSYIFRQTLNVSMYVGVLIAVTFEIVRLMILLAFVKQA